MSMLDQMIEAGGRELTTRPAFTPPADAVAADTGAGRLTTGQLVVTLQRLGLSLQNANDSFSKLPDATPDQLGMLLETIIAQAKGAQAHAERLLKANR